MIDSVAFQSVLSFLDAGLADFSGWQILVYTLIVTHVTIAGVTIYLHRSQAHRALDLHPIVSHFFRFWLWLTTGMVTREWVAIHRKHHARCETPDDPHSPQTRGIRKVLFEGAELYRAEAKNRETIEKFSHGTPDDWIERNLYTRHSALGVSLLLILNVALFGVIGLTVWAVQMLWIPVNAAGIINGIGHYWGYRNWDSADASTNVFPIGILIGGEELHNNHHAYGSSAKFSSKWYEFDIGWLYIRILSALGLATVRRLAPTPKFAAAKPAVDQETLHAVIQHRYDVMAQFAVSVRRACAEEARRLSRPQGRLLASARSWLAVDAAKWTADQRAKLGEIFAASEQVKKIVEMRNELSAIWDRSTLSREQLVVMLQQWCHRAEASGVRALQDIALRMRCYAAA
ncbi:MAG TPA: fatty acid desaturase [Quisquiliibacterium sp.]|nr:fatty acid desaturase [Quisquiliibacterium sp.]